MPQVDGVIEAPDDTDRVYWLERLSDEEIAEAALFMFGHRPDWAHIRKRARAALGQVEFPEVWRGGDEGETEPVIQLRRKRCRSLSQERVMD